MLNQNYTITYYDNNQAMLSWSASLPTDVSYIFVNGVLFTGDIEFASVDRYILIPFKKSKSIVLEIHDFAAPLDSILPIESKSNKIPTVAWQGVDAAVKYKLYGNNKLLYTIQKSENNDNYEKQVTFPEFYGKIWTWHFFTVTSVDQYGNESLLKYFPYFIWDLPPIVKEISVVNGSGAGLYNFTITL